MVILPHRVNPNNHGDIMGRILTFSQVEYRGYQKVKPNNHGDIESNFDVWSGGISWLSKNEA